MITLVAFWCTFFLLFVVQRLNKTLSTRGSVNFEVAAAAAEGEKRKVAAAAALSAAALSAAAEATRTSGHVF
jgi:hypothetical protein